MKGSLLLEDGSSFEGLSIGAAGERIGEVIFNTAVVGYQEMMTDPANAGKILVLTYPLIGNYGMAPKFNESKRCWIEGLVIKEESKIPSNWQAEDSFTHFLKNEKLLTLSGIDTRTLTVHIRDKGQMLGIISSDGTKKSDMMKKLKAYKKNIKKDFIKDISVNKITKITNNSSGTKIGILDLGILNNFLSQLKNLKCNITLLPYNMDADKILALKLDGLIISNGPEDDKAIPEIVKTFQKILGKIPILGIATGHEIIGLVLGGKRTRMKVGHHGVNYPVRSSSSFKGDITVQNHSFVVDEDSIKDKTNISVTLRNVNDNSIEEMESVPLRFISTQYYPVSPGFDEVHQVFTKFLGMIH